MVAVTIRRTDRSPVKTTLAVAAARAGRWAGVAAAAGLVAALLAGCGHMLPQSPTATLAEFKIDTDTTVKPGTYDYMFFNGGTLQHELLVFRPSLPQDHLAVDLDGNLAEDAPGMNKISDGDNINPAETQDRTIDLTAPGRYLFVCNLPGHYKNGMFTWVTVK
jgi:uncharacterized cupredoxin-like copper-binding protein